MNITTLAIMIIIGFILPPGSPTATRDSERTIIDFSQPSAERWRAVNDNVMGGRSNGDSKIVDGRLVFTGETRLENNGGFSSVRSGRADWNLEGAGELQMRVRGTAGRKYTMLLETSQRYLGMSVSYWYGFELYGDGWQVTRIPLPDFYPVFRGRKLTGRELDTSDIQSMGVMVYDKKAGPFRLEIDWVKATWTDSKKPATPAVLIKEVTSSLPDIVGLAKGADKFGTLLTAAVEAGLVDTLRSKGPFTVLAPTDDAFAALPEGTLASLLKPENRDQLKSILLYHVFSGSLGANELLTSNSAKSLQGQDVVFTLSEGHLKAGEANILLNDLEASNGMVHAIDRVLLPRPEAGPAQRLIKIAVSKGVEQFNDGQVEACAAIYEVAVTAILDFGAPGLSPAIRKTLADSLKSAKVDHDVRRAAWTLRRAMDAALGSLAK